MVFSWVVFGLAGYGKGRIGGFFGSIRERSKGGGDEGCCLSLVQVSWV